MLIKAATSTLPLLPLAMAPTLGEGNAVVLWILGLAGVAVIFNQVAAAWKTMTTNLKELPAPSQTYATKTDCSARHSAIETRLKELVEEADRSDSRQETRVSAIHARINDVFGAVSQLRGEVSQMNRERK